PRLLRALRSTLFPYTTLFRSHPGEVVPVEAAEHRVLDHARAVVEVDEAVRERDDERGSREDRHAERPHPAGPRVTHRRAAGAPRDRKSTRLNSSHSQISYAVF